MKDKEYKRLVDVHLSQKIWRNEIELWSQETAFFEDILHETETWAALSLDQTKAATELMNQIHHFERLCGQSLIELDAMNKEVAEDIQSDEKLGIESKDDQEHFKIKMEYFEQNYRLFKKEFRGFVATLKG